MMSANAKSVEKARKDFEAVFQRCINTRWGDLSEQDTLTKFIHPMVETLGWNILDLNDMREEVFVKTGEKENHIDIVLYFHGKPYIGMEVKGMSYGNILDETKKSVREGVAYLLGDLLRKSKQLNVKYAVLTRFAETLVVEPHTASTVATFHSPREHLEKFSILWKLLSKPNA